MMPAWFVFFYFRLFEVLDGLALGLADSSLLAALVGPREVCDGDDEERVAGRGKNVS